MFLIFNNVFVSANYEREMFEQQSKLGAYFLSEENPPLDRMNPFVLMGLNDTVVGKDIIDTDELSNDLRPYIIEDIEDKYMMYAMNQDGEMGEGEDDFFDYIDDGLEVLEEFEFLSDNLPAYDELLSTLDFLSGFFDKIASAIEGIMGVFHGSEEERIRAEKITLGLDYANPLDKDSLDNYDWWRDFSEKTRSFVSGLLFGSGEPTTQEKIEESIQKIVNRTDNKINKTQPRNDDFDLEEEYDPQEFNHILDVYRASLELNNMPVEHQSMIHAGGIENLDRDFPNNHFAVDIRDKNVNHPQKNNKIDIRVRHNFANYIISQDLDFVDTTNRILSGELSDSNDFSSHIDLSRDFLYNYLQQIFNNDYIYTQDDMQDLEEISKELSESNSYEEQLDKVGELEEIKDEVSNNKLNRQIEVTKNNLVPDIKNQTLIPFTKSLTDNLEHKAQNLFKQIIEDMLYLYPNFKPDFEISRLEKEFDSEMKREIKDFNHLSDQPISLLRRINEILEHNFDTDISHEDFPQNDFEDSLELKNNYKGEMGEIEKEKIESFIESYSYKFEGGIDLPYDLTNLNPIRPYSDSFINDLHSNVENANKNLEVIKDKQKDFYEQLPDDFMINKQKEVLESELEILAVGNNNLTQSEFEEFWDVLEYIFENGFDINFEVDPMQKRLENVLSRNYNLGNFERTSKTDLAFGGNEKKLEIYHMLDSKFENEKIMFNSFYERILEDVNMEDYQETIIEFLEDYQENILIDLDNDESELEDNLKNNYNLSVSNINTLINELGNEAFENIENNFELLKEFVRMKTSIKNQRRIYQNMLEFILTRNKLNYQKEYFEEINEDINEAKNNINTEKDFEKASKEIIQNKIILNIIKNRYIDFSFPYYYEQEEIGGQSTGFKRKEGLEELEISNFGRWITELNGTQNLMPIALDFSNSLNYVESNLESLKEKEDLLSGLNEMEKETKSKLSTLSNKISYVKREFAPFFAQQRFSTFDIIDSSDGDKTRNLESVNHQKVEEKIQKGLSLILESENEIIKNDSFLIKNYENIKNNYESYADLHLKNLGQEVADNNKFIKSRAGDKYNELLYRLFHVKVYETQTLDINNPEGGNPLLEDEKYSAFRDVEGIEADLSKEEQEEDSGFREVREMLARVIDYSINFEDLFKDYEEGIIKDEHKRTYRQIPGDNKEEKEKRYVELRNRILKQAGIKNEEIPTFDERNTEEVQKIYGQDFIELNDSEQTAQMLNDSLPLLATNYGDLMDHNIEEENILTSRNSEKNGKPELLGMEGELIQNSFEQRGIEKMEDLSENFHIVDEQVDDNYAFSYTGNILTFLDMYLWNMIDDFDYEGLDHDERIEKRSEIRKKVLELLNYYGISTYLEPDILEKEIKAGDLDVMEMYFDIFDENLEKKLKDLRTMIVNFNNFESRLEREIYPTRRYIDIIRNRFGNF